MTLAQRRSLAGVLAGLVSGSVAVLTAEWRLPWGPALALALGAATLNAIGAWGIARPIAAGVATLALAGLVLHAFWARHLAWLGAHPAAGTALLVTAVAAAFAIPQVRP